MSENQIIEKIKKLLLKAESAQEIGSLAEAEAFMAKVNEMLLENNLSAAQVKETAAGTDEFKAWGYSCFISYKENQAGNRWKKDLIKILCKHNLCGVIFSKFVDSFQIYGNIENVESVMWLFNFLSVRLLNMAKKSRKENTYEASIVCRHTYLKDYLSGATKGIHVKLERMKQESQHSDSIRDLIIFNDAALDRYLNKKWPDNRQTNASKLFTHSRGAYSEGFQEGKGMSFGGKLTAEKKVESKLLK